jgi:hypothetical protein
MHTLRFGEDDPMRNICLKSLALSLGLLAPAAYAADPNPATTERPVAPTAPSPAVVLGRPVPVGANPTLPPTNLPILDRQVRPTTFESADRPAPANGGQVPDPIIARPLPVSPAPINPIVVAPAWRKAGETEPPPELAPPPSRVEPAPVTTDCGSFLGHFLHGWRGDGCDGCGSFLDHITHWWRGDGCDACATATDCGSSCCGGCAADPCNRWYASAEYLGWWFKGQSLPPLVTSGSMGDPIPGALGSPGTKILFGGEDMENGLHSGGRFMIGRWFGCDHCIGLEGGYFFLGPGVTNFVASSNGTPILTRPFINAATGAESAELIAGPGVLAGTVTVQTRSSMWGAETNLRHNVWSGCHSFLDVLAGFRVMGLNEDLIVHEKLTVLRAPGGAFDLVDHFQTANRFYGGQVGADWQYRCRCWDIDIKAKVGLGSTQQLVNISGNDLIVDPVSGTRAFNSGLLAQQSNIGEYARNRFTVVPEVGITVGYHLTEHLRIFAGYNFLYWSSVVRPGAQIDRTVNVNQIAPPIPGGPARPAFSFNGTDFWAQGVTAGLEYKW